MSVTDRHMALCKDCVVPKRRRELVEKRVGGHDYAEGSRQARRRGCRADGATKPPPCPLSSSLSASLSNRGLSIFRTSHLMPSMPSRYLCNVVGVRLFINYFKVGDFTTGLRDFMFG